MVNILGDRFHTSRVQFTNKSCHNSVLTHAMLTVTLSHVTDGKTEVQRYKVNHWTQQASNVK